MYVMLNGIGDDSSSLQEYASHKFATESLISSLHTSSGPLPQVIMVLFQYSTSNLRSTISDATTVQNIQGNCVNKANSNITQDKEDHLGEVNKNKSESSATSQEQRPRRVDEEQAVSYQKELVIGCIKSSLVKKQSGEYVIEALNTSSNPLAKCFTIDPLKVLLSLVLVIHNK